jgi:gamma-glutamylcyclotransferase (GGCT)/AIG2-like uncharacterized protein YtfP
MAAGSGRKAFSGSSDVVLQNETPGELYYFAYGSNMNKEQISARCFDPKVVAVAKLADHQLTFFGHSPVWDGGEETVVPAPGHDVWGVVYELSSSDRGRLDDVQDARMDGSGGYFHSPARVTGEAGDEYKVLLYKKTSQGTPQKPSQECLNFIVQSAVDRELPSAYVETLRGMEAKKAEFAVPRQRKSVREGASGGCSDCDDEPASVININLG